MADSVDDRRAARGFDDVGDGPARTDVVDHLRSRLLLEHRLRKERRHEVTGHELTGVVHEEAPIRVAVERDPQIGALVLHLADDELAILGQERVGLVVREAAVRLEEAPHGSDRKPVEDRREHRAGHAVCGIEDNAERSDRLDVHEREDALCEGVVDILRALPSRLTVGRGFGERAVADVEEARSLPDRQGALADDLEAGVLLWVMRGGDHDPAFEPELVDGEVEHLGADQADVDDVGSAWSAPAITALAMAGEDRRVSRPTAMASTSKCPTNARPIRCAPSSSSSSGWMPRTSYALKTFGSSVIAWILWPGERLPAVSVRPCCA